MDKAQILANLQNQFPKLKEFGVARIGIFGSVVHGRDEPESDIDILVHFDRGKKTYDNYMHLKFFLEEIFDNREIDLVIDESLKPDLKQYILKSVEYVS
jgi:predicted nucleotidyltransferase